MSPPWTSRYPPWRGFYEAILQGNTDHVTKCLHQNMDFRLLLSGPKNALDLAAVNGQVEVVEVILASSQFKNLARHEKRSILTACLAMCGEESVAVFEYLLSLKEPWIYPDLHAMLKPAISITDRILSLNLTPEHDGILKLLPDVEYEDLDSEAETVKEALSSVYFGTWDDHEDRTIYRQEILCIMKKYSLSSKQVCDILEIEPLLLESCIGDAETVEKLLDEWFGSESFEKWLSFTYQTRSRRRKIGREEFDDVMDTRCTRHLQLRNEKHQRPEVIAARSRRADLLVVILGKLKSKLDTLDVNRERIWKHTLWTLLEKHVRDVNVLRLLPDEAFDMDGQIPANSDGYDGLPWFFLGEGSVTLDRPDSRLIRELLHSALHTGDHDRFQFYVDRFKIHEAQIYISNGIAWYKLPEDDSTEEVSSQDSATVVKSRNDEIVDENGNTGDFRAGMVVRLAEDYWNELYENDDQAPLERLPTARMFAQYGSHEEEDLREFIYMCGDVRILQSFNHRTRILDSRAPYALLGPICNGIYNPGPWDETLPLPMYEHIIEYHRQAKPRDGGSRSRDLRSNRFNFLRQDGLLDPSPGWDLLTTYVREALKITLTRSMAAANSLADMKIKRFLDSDEMFKTKRDMKLLNFVIQDYESKTGEKFNGKNSHAKSSVRENFLRIATSYLTDLEGRDERHRIECEKKTLGEPYFGHPRLGSREREKLLINCFPHGSFLFPSSVGMFSMALLIAAMGLHDFGKDFGPNMNHISFDNNTKEYVDIRRLFLRDFVLGLCGSLLFSMSAYGMLSLLVGDAEKLKIRKHFLVRQVCILVANSGIAIKDVKFHHGTQLLLPMLLERSDIIRSNFEEGNDYARVSGEHRVITEIRQTGKAKVQYHDTMTEEHPEITVERRRLSLAARCRIIIHRFIKLSPGFLSDKVRSLNLPNAVERFVLFEDMKEMWDNRGYLKDLTEGAEEFDDDGALVGENV